jgi:hypothetical protein
VLQYNHDDFLIPVRYEAVYPAMVQSAGGRAPIVLPSAGEGHCGFASEQIMQAFKTLTREVHGESASGMF